VDALSGLPDAGFIAALVAISGIGPWTAQGCAAADARATSRCGDGDLTFDFDGTLAT
jgi:hypothetical protein